MKDLEDFTLEEKLVKKLKKGINQGMFSFISGQISLEEFKRKMKEIDGDDDLDEDETKYI